MRRKREYPKLAEYYVISTDYLLRLTENIKYRSFGIQELKIDDAMAELLQSGHINNRLLRELATHPAFSKLMIDLETVISDIRANHKKDTENAADINITDKINEAFDDINNYNGNLLDLLMYYFCKEIRLPLSSLSSEEIQTMRALFQRSGRYKSEARLFRKGRKK